MLIALYLVLSCALSKMKEAGTAGLGITALRSGFWLNKKSIMPWHI